MMCVKGVASELQRMKKSLVHKKGEQPAQDIGVLPHMSFDLNLKDGTYYTYDVDFWRHHKDCTECKQIINSVQLKTFKASQTI